MAKRAPDPKQLVNAVDSLGYPWVPGLHLGVRQYSAECDGCARPAIPFRSWITERSRFQSVEHLRRWARQNPRHASVADIEGGVEFREHLKPIGDREFSRGLDTITVMTVWGG